MSKHQTEWTAAQRAAVCHAVLVEGKDLVDVLETARNHGLGRIRRFDMPYSTAAAYVKTARGDHHFRELGRDPVEHGLEVLRRGLATIFERIDCGVVSAREQRNALSLLQELQKARRVLRNVPENEPIDDEPEVSSDVEELLTAA
jgi:hypothetical protein